MSEFYEFYGKNYSLQKIVEKFNTDIKSTLVITMDKLGAIIVPKSDKILYMGWPYELGKYLADTTGAGDAFGAGFFSYTLKPEFNNNFRAAVKQAREWAAFACSKLGGSNLSPNSAQLNDFLSKIKPFERIEEFESNDKVIRLIDRMNA
jgi:sugar/nucleoside kinase (ribokinase family)